MKIVSFFVLLIFIIFNFFNTEYVFASQDVINCDNRFVTLVNPVRGRDLWVNKSVNPLIDQYNLVKHYSFGATWLLQYDVLKDKELLDEIKKFDEAQELGIFLEISQKSAEDARVIYPHSTPWFSPKAVFLSGYSQSDRRKLINKLLKEFKNKFGIYPKSVGAWWIDSYSLNYLKDKYGIRTALIVADQKTTDNYGVWGQWWGLPYYPSRSNILTPASSLKNKLDVVVIQWAQRDPLLAFGEGERYSNYSLQANDYIKQGKDTTYFNELANVYLDCRNNLGQVTVGLETGIESVGNLGEYQNQLESLSKIDNLQFVTMSQFAQKYGQIYPDLAKNLQIQYKDSIWKLNSSSRANEKVNDYIKYSSDIAFGDYFVADTSNFLDRRLEQEVKQVSSKSFDLYIIIILLSGFYLYFKRKILLWFISILFAVASFGTILKSSYQMGWKIYYGPVVPYLDFVKVGIILLSLLIIFILFKKWKNFWLAPLIFGLDPLIQSLRFSFISGKYYAGTVVDTLRFVGITFTPPWQINFISHDLPSYQVSALLRFNIDKIWDNLWLSLIIYPVTYIFSAIFLMYLLPKLPIRIRFNIIIVLILLFIWHINSIIIADPRIVIPNLLK